MRIRILRGVAAATVLAAGLITTEGGVAFGDPGNSPSASPPFTIDCGSLGSGTFITNSGKSHALTWNPFFVTSQDGLSTIDPTAYDYTISVDGTPVFSPDVAKGSAPGSVTCVLSGGSGGVTVVGTITGNPV